MPEGPEKKRPRSRGNATEGENTPLVVAGGGQNATRRALDCKPDAVAGIATVDRQDWGGGGPVPRSGTAPAALPCQNSNNCPAGGSAEGSKPGARRGYRWHRKRTVFAGKAGFGVRIDRRVTEAGEGLDHEGRLWVNEGGVWVREVGGLSSAELKRAFALRQNVEGFAEHYQHARCGFLTLTPQGDAMTPKEVGAAWHDMRKHRLRWVVSYVRVLEPQKRGAPHYHLMVATPWDLKPEAFDWEALQGAAEARQRGDLAEARRLTRAYAQSATDELRAVWSELREACAHYGLGRSEFLPFRKGAGAVANYVGKYLEKGLTYRRDEWKGARRVEYDRVESRTWKRCGSAFGWVSPGAALWRVRVGQLASAVNAKDLVELRRRLGARWGYNWRAEILTATDAQWLEVLGYLAAEYGGRIPDNAKPIRLIRTNDGLEAVRVEAAGQHRVPMRRKTGGGPCW